MSNSSTSLQAWIDGGSQHVIGGILAIVGAVHFVLWTQRGDGATFATAVGAKNVAEAAGYGQEYLTTHPAYPLLVLLGLIVIVRAYRS